ncbi:MAG: hypothetical protein H6908_05135 [Hyphomicrobiales bacterium]|nr:hypothetical protein [Hyphomicrobiales bacterium]
MEWMDIWTHISHADIGVRPEDINGVRDIFFGVGMVVLVTIGVLACLATGACF